MLSSLNDPSVLKTAAHEKHIAGYKKQQQKKGYLKLV